jgi:5-methyltetrahydrofolate--homocysteine methyltransferase
MPNEMLHPLAETLKKSMLRMKRDETIRLVKEALSSDMDPLLILKACREGMEEVGEKFETGEFFLSELIYSAEVFKSISALLEPALMMKTDGESRGELVFGTPRGDIHDLGKNIVVTMMRSQGFMVHDLGVNIPSENFIEELKRTKASILAFSALITPAFESIRETIDLLRERGMRENTFVIIGGGVTTEFARKELGADAQTLDPMEAIRLCSQYLLNRPRSI